MFIKPLLVLINFNLCTHDLLLWIPTARIQIYQNFVTSATGNETQTKSNEQEKKYLTFYHEGIRTKQERMS